MECKICGEEIELSEEGMLNHLSTHTGEKYELAPQPSAEEEALNRINRSIRLNTAVNIANNGQPILGALYAFL